MSADVHGFTEFCCGKLKFFSSFYLQE